MLKQRVMCFGFFKTIRVRNACDGINNLYLEEPSNLLSGGSCEVESHSHHTHRSICVCVEVKTYDSRGKRIGRKKSIKPPTLVAAWMLIFVILVAKYHELLYRKWIARSGEQTLSGFSNAHASVSVSLVSPHLIIVSLRSATTAASKLCMTQCGNRWFP